VLGTRQADEGAERLSFGGVLRGSLPYFWRVAGLALIFAAAFFAAYVLMVLLFMGIGLATFGLGAICVFPLFILIIPVVYLALALVEQSQISVITGGLGIGAALRRGWQLVTEDVWRYLGLSLILYLALAFALGLALTLIMIPMFIPMLAAAGSNGQPDQTILALSLLCVGLMAPFYALVQGMYMAFVRATWTVANLHPKPAPAEVPPAGELLSAG
jgi:hypothetical protein